MNKIKMISNRFVIIIRTDNNLSWCRTIQFEGTKEKAENKATEYRRFYSAAPFHVRVEQCSQMI